MDEFSNFLEGLRSRLAPAEGFTPACVAEADTNGGGPLRHAAVALVLRRRVAEVELLVIKRSESERDHWSGHLALPGGRMEGQDTDLLATAVRETFEEVGLDVSAGGEVVGRLGTVTPQSPLAPRVSVTPFVAVAPREYHVGGEGELSRGLSLSPEVAAAFWFPVSELRNGGRSGVFRMLFAGVEREWPAYPSPHGPIWGITERILTEFLFLAG